MSSDTYMCVCVFILGASPSLLPAFSDSSKVNFPTSKSFSYTGLDLAGKWDFLTFSVVGTGRCTRNPTDIKGVTTDTSEVILESILIESRS